MLDLNKLMIRVEEFNEYGDMDMMQQYVKDVMTVQKKINELQGENLLCVCYKLEFFSFLNNLVISEIKFNFHQISL